MKSTDILQLDPTALPAFINKNQDTDGEGQGSATALSMKKGMAALRQAQGLSNSYAPAGAGKEIAGMAASAQYNLGIEAAQGLSPHMGPAGSNMGQSDDEPPEKKKEKSEDDQE